MDRRVERGISSNKTLLSPRVIDVYPTVEPEVVVIPILTSISVFPVLAFVVICCLRRMAAKRRQRDRLKKSRGQRSFSAYRSPPLSLGFETTTTTTLELLTTPEEVSSSSPFPQPFPSEDDDADPQPLDIRQELPQEDDNDYENPSAPMNQNPLVPTSRSLLLMEKLSPST